MAFIYLKIYAAITGVMSVGFISLQLVLKYDNTFVSVTLPRVMRQSKMSKIILVFILVTSRHFLNFSKEKFEDFSRLSSVILFLFHLTRLNVVISNVTTQSKLTLILIVVIYIIALINTFIRFSIFLGNAIDTKNEKPFVFFWDDIPPFLRSFGKINTPNSPQSNFQSNWSKVDRLKKGGMAAAILMLPIAGYSLYELRLTRIATERAADAAEIAAKAAQQKADVKAYQHGLMTGEEFRNKYPGDKK